MQVIFNDSLAHMQLLNNECLIWSSEDISLDVYCLSLLVCNMMHDSFSTTQVSYLQEVEITEHVVFENISEDCDGLYVLTL